MLRLLVFPWVWSHVDDNDEAVCKSGRWCNGRWALSWFSERVQSVEFQSKATLSQILLDLPNEWQRKSELVVVVLSCKWRWMASVVFLTSFVQHLFSLVIHLCLSGGPCLAPRLLFFLITYPGIDVTSRLFWSNSVGLCEDFIFLPQLQ